MFTVIGLENEGGRGRFARHAVGARFLDYVRDCGCFGEWIVCAGYVFADGKLADVPVRLIKQIEGKLHNCGEILGSAIVDYMIEPARVVVAHDEARWGLGDENFAYAGYDDHGHLGLRSLISECGTDHFVRAEIGIGEIPDNKGIWEEFFNGELDAASKVLVMESFARLYEAFCTYIREYRPRMDWSGEITIPLEIARAAQIHGRKQNLAVSPVLVRLSKKHLREVEKAVITLVHVIQHAATKYSRICYELEDPSGHPLAALLESGISAEMRVLVRRTQFHIEGLSFDFHGGRLLEINAAPLPPFVACNVARHMGFSAFGVLLTPQMLCERVEIMINRLRLGSKLDNVVLVDKVGEVSIGTSGWFRVVQEYLVSKSSAVRVGTPATGDGVVWANLTWMTPERWSTVLTSSVMNGESWIFPSPRNFLFTSKRFLAALCNQEEREVIGVSPAESKVLDTAIPWTGLLGRDKRFALYALECGQRLYGKPYVGSGSRGGNAISNWGRDSCKVERPAVVQEWVPPYRIGGTNLRHDLRVCVYGPWAQNRVYSARVWEDSETIARPMDSPVMAI